MFAFSPVMLASSPVSDSAAVRSREPFHIMVKPMGPLCNLDCRYCFYLEKASLFAGNEKWRMSDAMLERYVQAYIEAQPEDVPITFAWQGGEPTLCGVDFFRKAVRWQKQYGAGRQIENAFQTNGTLLNDEWGTFLADENFLVGVSIDGPESIHDAYRVDRKGKGTWREVMRGIEVLKRHRVDFNTLTCVHRRTSKKPEDVYRFLKGIGSRYLQFIPIVERKANAPADRLGLSLAVPPPLDFPEDEVWDDPDCPVTPWSVRPRDYGEFLVKIFDQWVRRDVGRIYVQLFDTALGKWLQIPGGLCIFSETCGRAMALEHNGDLYACDHFVYPGHRLGNIAETPIGELADSPRQAAFGQAKRETLPQQCQDCAVRFACNGGCPKQRFATTRDGESGLNYLCAGYERIFTHMDPYMHAMAQLYREGRPPAMIMDLLAQKKVPGVR